MPLTLGSSTLCTYRSQSRPTTDRPWRAWLVPGSWAASMDPSPLAPGALALQGPWQPWLSVMHTHFST